MIQRSPSGLLWVVQHELPRFERKPPNLRAHDTGTPTWDVPFFRWYNDDGSLTAMTPLLGENVVATVGQAGSGADLVYGANWILRFTFDETNLGDPGNRNITVRVWTPGVTSLDSQTVRAIHLVSTSNFEFDDTVSTQRLSSPSGSFRNGKAWDDTTPTTAFCTYVDNFVQDDFTEQVVAITGNDGAFQHDDEISFGAIADSDPEPSIVVARVVDPGGLPPLDHKVRQYMRY